MRKIKLYGAIGRDITDSEFISQIPENGNEDLEIRINSPGGSVFQGWAIYNALIDYKGKKLIHIDGVAASMASVIAMAGDEIYMSENALYMIHNPSSTAQGNANELRKEADLMDKIKGIMVDSYHKKTGIPKTELEKMLDDETWFSAQEAKESKFINDVKSKVLVQNTAVQGHDRMQIYASFSLPINNHKIISELGMSADASEQDILNKIKTLKSSKPTQEEIDKAKELVKQANLDKKITADFIPFYESLAVKSYQDVKGIFDKIPSLRPVSESIIESAQSKEDRTKWTLEDYRMKDPKALENKELFKRLLNNK
jgi:ATP-dependent Clp endopeptidase proteolytic subunit ClpP